MRFVRRLVILGLIVTLLPLAASLGYARFWVEPEHQPAAAIIVLSGPGALQTGLVGESQARVERGVELFQAGLAPRLIMTGGSPGDISAAVVMRDHAIGLGVPGVTRGDEITFAPNLGWENVRPLQDSGLSDRRAVLINDVNAGLLG